MLTTAAKPARPWARRATQKVVVVNGSRETLALIESILDAGHYDVVFAAELPHAYSAIKTNRPDLVVLCLSVDEPEGFQVLSMLHLDNETRRIPVLTYTRGPADVAPDTEPDDELESEFQRTESALTRN